MTFSGACSVILDDGDIVALGPPSLRRLDLTFDDVPDVDTVLTGVSGLVDFNVVAVPLELLGAPARRAISA